MRRITDPVTVRGALGDLQRVVSYSRDPWVHSHQVSLTPDEGFVLSRVDGQISMADILSLSPLGEDETLRCLYGLVSSGFLEFGPKTREVTPSRKSKRFYDMGNVERGRARPEKPSISKPPVNHEEQWVREDIEEKHASLAAGNYYDWLEVRRRASAADLKKAYSYLIKKYHPDRHRAKVLEDLSPALQEIITKVREAYESLSEPLTRRRYDNSLRTEAPRGEVNSRPAALERPAEPPAPDPAEKRAEHYYQEARRHFENQDYHATVRLLEEAVELVPSNGAYHRLLGQALAKNPKWRRNAEEHFKIALRLDPVDIQALIFLGGLYQSVSMKSRAKAIFAGVQGRPGQLGNPQPPRRSGEGDPVPLVVVALGRIAIAKQLGLGQGSGTQPFYLENVENFRSENVTILDLRFEKTFRLSGRNRLTTMLDIYNATNDNPGTISFVVFSIDGRHRKSL